ncbi:MAG TPA: peptide chain release factor N(5)-glutamine methyltransferase [Candidatus Dormibacteraeota bacterium]|nr:peptide chain release factor N(5)-glutamine methyltransferase [Candidatus Dormibacteraeota bacterium]
MPTTLMDVVRLSARHLADRGSDSARLDAELLAAHALGLRRLDLYLQHDRPLDEAELVPIRALLRRRAAGEPVAYIVGEREFYGRPFAVTPAVLIPRPETELLVERALAFLHERAAGTDGPLGSGVAGADLGTGSGCIGVTLACEATGLDVVAGDVSAAAVEVARANAVRHGVQDRVRISVAGWWAACAGAAVDLVVSNPPYISDPELGDVMRDVRDHEPRDALSGGHDGLAAYRDLLRDAGTGLVRPGGAVLLEVTPERAGAVAGMAGEAWPAATVAVHPDLAGRDRCVEVRVPA